MITYQTDFFQECPVCGRPLQIHVEYLGHIVACEHCGGQFVATDPFTQAPSGRLLHRADELLALSNRRLSGQPVAG